MISIVRALTGTTAVLALAAAAPAGAQPLPTAPASPPMEVKLVRSAQPGCEPACPEWIAAQGRIDATTPGEFRKILTRLGTRKAPILIDSAGGAVDPALAIGRMIRAKGLDVVVTRTALKPCEPGDAACRKLAQQRIHLGLPEARLSRCTSSCAFVLAGGVRRHVGPMSFVGLHEIITHHTQRQVLRTYRVERRLSWGVPVETRRTLVKEQVLSQSRMLVPTEERTYDRIRKFFAEMGIAETVMALLRSAPNSSIRWLRPAELRSTSLATDLTDGEQLLLTQPTATAEAPGSMPIERAATPTERACTALPGSNVACTTGSVLGYKPVPPAASPPAARPAAATLPVAAAPAALPVPAPLVAAPAAAVPAKAEAAPATPAPAPAAATAPAAKPKAPPPRPKAAARSRDDRPVSSVFD